MAQIKGKNTKPEIKLRSLLHRAGFRFRIHVNTLPGTPDIVLPRYRTVIFVNGCFWHRHENCKYAYNPKSRQDFWQKKFSSTIKRDCEKTDKLMRAGWQVLTVWECELRNNPEAIVHDLALKIIDFTNQSNRKHYTRESPSTGLIATLVSCYTTAEEA